MLTPKQAKFVAEYAKDANATQAAIRAGYSERTAYSIGFENLRKPEIVAALEVVNATALQVVAQAQQEAVADVAWIVAKAVDVVERAMTPVPVYYRGEPTAEMQFAGGVAVSALTLLAKRFPEFRDAAPVDQSQHMHFPPGTTIEDIRALRDGLR